MKKTILFQFEITVPAEIAQEMTGTILQQISRYTACNLVDQYPSRILDVKMLPAKLVKTEGK